MPTQRDNVKTVQNLFEFAKGAMQFRREQWEQNYKFWSATNLIRRPRHKDNVRVPLIFMLTDSIQAILTDNNPKVIFYPQEKDDIKTSDNLSQIYQDYYWDILKLTRFSEEMIWWASNVSGSAIGEYGIDQRDGEQFVSTVNSFTFFPDPSVRSLEACEFIDQLSIWSMRDLARVYGKEVVKGLKPENELMNFIRFHDMSSPWDQQKIRSADLMPVFKDQAFKKEFGRIMVHKMWLRDDSMEKIPFDVSETDEEHQSIIDQLAAVDTGELAGEAVQIPEIGPGVKENHPEHMKSHGATFLAWENTPDAPPKAMEMLHKHMAMHGEEDEDGKRPKYPRGKFITTAGDRQLEERPAIFGHGYVKMDFIADPTDFWGKTLQQYVQGLQENVERAKRQISDSADRTANPREFYDDQRGYDPNDSKGNPGERIAVTGNPRDVVYTESLPPVQGYVITNANDSERLAEKIVGLPELAQGVEPRNDISGKAIKTLQEALGPRMRKISRHYEEMLRDLHRALFEMLPFEDPSRIFAVLGKDATEQDYIELSQLHLNSEYHIRIGSGSTLPTSRAEKLDTAFMLFDKGMARAVDALRMMDMPEALQMADAIDKEQQMEQTIEILSQENQDLTKRVEQNERRQNNSSES